VRPMVRWCDGAMFSDFERLGRTPHFALSDAPIRTIRTVAPSHVQI